MNSWPAPFDLNQVAQLAARQVDLNDYPNAVDCLKNVLIYRADSLAATDAVKRELFRALSQGPGVFVVKQAQPNHSAIDQATQLFSQIIEDEKSAGTAKGDHFAKPGANDRIWNSLEKHCLADPQNFAQYYAMPAVDLVCEAWLGPAYQMTAQVNRVNPGGAAQNAHRDYHLGFMSDSQKRAFPEAMHMISPLLTLQGGLAHMDMPLETGPTLFLPFTQLWDTGYLYYSHAELQTYFDENHVQLALDKGDAVFFNPAILHAAGTNRTTDVKRLTNLFQVSSAMGRSMEAVDRTAMSAIIEPLIPALCQKLDQAQLMALIGATAEGYAFPTNLDTNPPVSGGAPQTQADQLKFLMRSTKGVF